MSAKEGNLDTFLSNPAARERLRSAVAKGRLDFFADAMQKRTTARREKELRSCALAEGATLLPEATIRNLAEIQERMAIGEGTYVRGELLVFRFGGRLTIGRHCYLGEDSRIWAGESVQIGDHVLISHNVFITDCSAHEVDAFERAKSFQEIVSIGHPASKGSVRTVPVVIRNHVWINPQTVILPGVEIGEGAIIGAGSIVTKNIPASVLAAGNPARVIHPLEASKPSAI
jgi:acetyltransferase-like isoleucine patch superfamily enzyme